VSALRLAPEVAAWAQAAADLVNTAPRATNPEERLTGLPALERLLAGCPEPAPPAAKDDVAALRQVRARLRAAFEAQTLAALAEALNPLLGEWGMRRGSAGWTLGPAAGEGVAGWFGARAARGLAELALAYDIDRLHLCGADDCLRAVVDVSRNGTRRYCSRTCASRVNVRRHRRVHDRHIG
jgi:predicted RNA-binding Zn ribbon-like protein